MEPSEPDSSNQKTRKDENVQPPSCGLSAARVSRSRFLSCLMIAAVFIILDLAILLYFLWPSIVGRDVDSLSPVPTEIGKAINESADPDAVQVEK